MMKFTVSENRMLAMYYALRSITSENDARAHEILCKLGKIYCVSPAQIEELYLLSEKEELSSIRCYDDYLVTMRAIDYCERFTKPLDLSEEILFALSAKDRGLGGIHDLLNQCGKKPQLACFAEKVTNPSFANNVFIASLVAFMYYEGIFLPYDREKADRLVDTCLQWNYIDGALLALAYGNSVQKEKGLSVLYTVTQRAGLLKDFAPVFEAYPLIPKRISQESLLLADYLDQNEKASQTYDPLVGKVVSSSFLSLGDRTRLMKLGDKRSIVILDDLALSVLGGEGSAKPLSSLLGEERRKEADLIQTCLNNQKSARLKVPLLLCRDKVALRAYETALEKSGADVVCLDCAGITMDGFAPTKANNMIVQTLIERGKSNVTFLLKGLTELIDADAEHLSAMLDPSKRASFLLQDVGVRVDLSDCTFVLLSDTENLHESILKVSQRVKIANAGIEEGKEFARSVICETTRVYNCPHLTFHEDALVYLASLDLAEIESVVTSLCMEHNGETEKAVLHKEDLLKVENGVGRQMTFSI